MNKAASKGSVIALLIVLLLTGCSGSPEKRAGRWEATSEFGDFAFVIDETGTMITHMEHDLECKTGTMPNSKSQSPQALLTFWRSGSILSGTLQVAMKSAWELRDPGLAGAVGLCAGRGVVEKNPPTVRLRSTVGRVFLLRRSRPGTKPVRSGLPKRPITI